MEKRFQKRSVLQDLSLIFLFRRVNSEWWSISKKNKTMEEPMKQKLKIQSINSITLLYLIQIQDLNLSKYFLINYSNLKTFWIFILQHTKKNDKDLYFANFFFH